MTENKPVVNEEGYEEVKPNNVTFYKVNDYIRGTYIDKFTPTQPDAYGKIKTAYVLKAEEGSLQEEDGTKVEVVKGDHWRVWGGKAAIDNAFKKAEIGQKVIVRLTEIRPSKLGNPAKIIKTLLGPMDADAVENF